LNLRAGGRLPKGFLLPLNLSKVLAGLPAPRDADLANGFLPAKVLVDFLNSPDLAFAAKPPADLVKGFLESKDFEGLRGKSP